MALWTLVLAARAWGIELTPLVDLPGGRWLPLYPTDPSDPWVEVAPFRLDRHPVTRGQFLAFVAEYPRWRPGAPPMILADAGYLASAGSWSADDRRPATEVSWHAARAYCEALGRRLPTEAEWEYAAQASSRLLDGRSDDAWRAEVLAWYAAPGGAPLAEVGHGTPNAWGVLDLYGLVWEWVEDFNNTLVAADAREAGDGENLRFCGVGALSATDVDDYARFMRVAWRSALEGRSTTRNLGFRCASDLELP